MNDATRAELGRLFEEVGQYQQAISDRGYPLSEGSAEILTRVRRCISLMPPDNEHVLEGVGRWIMYEWARAEQSGGLAASAPWDEFLVKFNNLMDESKQGRIPPASVDDSPRETGISSEIVEEILQGILSHLYPDQWGVVFPGVATWVSDGNFGAVFGYGSNAVRTGIALLSDLSVSDELLHEIADVNRTIGGGHFWLTEGETGNWQLVWGTSMLRDYFSEQFAADYLVQVVRALPLISAQYTERFQERGGGQRWWKVDSDRGAQALVLLSLTM